MAACFACVCQYVGVSIFWDYTLFVLSASSSFTPGGYLVQRSIRGRAAEMGLKISLLV